MFLFPSVSHVSRIAQKLQNPNLQYRYGHRDNSECDIDIDKDIDMYI